MSTANVLSTYREEITRCAQRREKLLRTLFGVTQSYLSLVENGGHDQTKEEDQQDRELNAFLDANDIQQNRFFDQSTLPHARSPRSAAYRLHRYGDTGISRGSGIAPLEHVGSLETSLGRKNIEDGRTSRDQATEDADSIPDEIRKDAFSSSGAASVGPRHAHEPQTTEALSGTKQKAASEERRSVTTGVEDGNLAKAVAVEGARQVDSNRTQQGASLTPPNSGRSLYANGKDAGTASARQMHEQNLAEGAPDRTPTTPDRQSSRPHGSQVSDQRTELVKDAFAGPDKSSSASELPSQFMEDTYADENTIINIPPLGDDDGKQQQEPALEDPASLSQRNEESLGKSASTSMNDDPAKDPTFSRRAPMRIDTGITPLTKHSTNKPELPATSPYETGTPGKPTPLSGGAQSPPERMTTRVSSGALRHKSVSEILGATPKSASPLDRSAQETGRPDAVPIQTPKSANSAVLSPESTAFKLRLHGFKDQDRSKLSTVVFAKQQASGRQRPSEFGQAKSVGGGEAPTEPRDYFLNFFAAQAFQPPRAPSLSGLLRQAHKSLSTPDFYNELREKQDFKVLGQIKELQQHDRWSLRQRERAPEPARQATHLDIMLGQMKWMRSDFREERRFKIAGAKHLAEACAAWVAAPEQTRQSLQVKVRQKVTSSVEATNALTPDLIHDETSEVTEDEVPSFETALVDPPGAIFSLPPDAFIFGLNKSPISEKILLELPCYEPAKTMQDLAGTSSASDPDATWKTPLIPVSKYTQGKLVSIEEGPPMKKPRLDVSEPFFNSTSASNEPTSVLPAANEDVALFNPENKHIRDRIHAGHAFRPPSEYQMPSREFFECRPPSQWTLVEDDDLRKLVREYSYNWSLISSCLSGPSLYSSGAERRTPWECFERWISLEGLPAEMSKVPYFQTYHQRLQQAARTYEARQLAMLQQQGGNPAQLPLRRRTNQPYTVEKRKNNKPLHLVDAMRKHAKKKEAALHKQQQQATLGALRKSNEQPKDRKPMPTARDMSRLKHERQLKIDEQSRALRMQYQSVQNTKKVSAHSSSQTGGSAPSKAQGHPGSNTPGGNPAAAMPQLRGGGNLDPGRSGSHMGRMVNGQTNGAVHPTGPGGPNAPMQAQMQAPMGQGVPAPGSNDARLFQQAQRVQAEQAYLQQQRQQQRLPQPNGQASSPNVQNISHAPQSTAPMLASMQGGTSPPVNGSHTTPGSNASPHLHQAQPQSLSSGMTPAVTSIQSAVKRTNPNATAEEVARLTTEQLLRLSQTHPMNVNQQAMAAAVGNSGGSLATLQGPNPMLQQHQAIMAANNNATVYNQQHQYAAYMRAQQANQQRTGSAGSGIAPTMGASRSGTPMVQRTGSAQGGASQSPRPGPAGIPGAPQQHSTLS